MTITVQQPHERFVTEFGAQAVPISGTVLVTTTLLAGGIPPKGSVEAIKAFDAKVIVFAPTLALAKKLLRSGGDALVIEGMEAGGHIGPVSTSVSGSSSIR